LSHTAAVETLRREAAGGKWDPVMVDQFAGMLGANPPNWEAIAQPVPSLYSS
jgi:HD-GYP domain-containing protein (c-di-GMP phosphodiesterase class II)